MAAMAATFELRRAAGKLVVGMLHAPPLPGSPRYEGDMAAVAAAVVREAEAWAAAGADALMLENFGDAPFHADHVEPATVAALAALAAAVRAAVGLPLGINVLRNDGAAAVAVAAATGAAFVRVNVLCGARVTDQGLIQGNAAVVARLRRSLGATHVRVLADVQVKHSAALAERPVEEEVADTLHRGMADALVVSGSTTGRAVDGGKLAAVRRAAGAAPVLVGSGVRADTVAQLAPHADGFIVGTSV